GSILLAEGQAVKEARGGHVPNRLEGIWRRVSLSPDVLESGAIGAVVRAVNAHVLSVDGPTRAPFHLRLCKPCAAPKPIASPRLPRVVDHHLRARTSHPVPVLSVSAPGVTTRSGPTRFGQTPAGSGRYGTRSGRTCPEDVLSRRRERRYAARRWS